MNYLEATRFLVLTMGAEEMKANRLMRVLLIRREVPGKRLGQLWLMTDNQHPTTKPVGLAKRVG